MNRRFLACRDLGHAWEWSTDRITVVAHSGAPTEFVRELTCLRCATVRRDEFAVRGGHIERLRNRYGYPKGYVTKGGVDRQEIRDAVFADLLVTEASRPRRIG